MPAQKRIQESEKIEMVLSEKMRPTELSDVVGQEKVVAFLKEVLPKTPSILLWGPPGSGKTTIARVIAVSTGLKIKTLSAVSDGLPALRKVIAESEEEPLLLFIDEIHRWNKAQQDALLPHVESGQITLIGATTENPGYEINPALRSRMQLLKLDPLSEKDIQSLIEKAASENNFKIEPEAINEVVFSSSGDARRALLLLDRALLLNKHVVTVKTVGRALGDQMPSYSRVGVRDDVISAFIKSMRAGDTDGALYWLARMRAGGEDPLFIARRLVIFASEDVGLSDPKALSLSVSVKEAVAFIGEPECWINLAHGTTYLSLAPKSWLAYRSWLRADEIVSGGEIYPPPGTVLKENYIHPHDSHLAEKHFSPKEVRGRIFKKEDLDTKPD